MDILGQSAWISVLPWRSVEPLVQQVPSVEQALGQEHSALSNFKFLPEKNNNNKKQEKMM